MNQVKIIFFDIDGTLLEMGKTEITPNTQQGVRLLLYQCLRGLYLMRFWPLIDLSALQVIRWWQNVLFRKKI